MFKKKAFILLTLLFGCLLIFGCGGELKLTKAGYYLGTEKYDEAIPIYQEYLSENPGSIRAKSQLGFAYLKTGRLDEAIEAFNAVLKTEPGEPYSILYLGLAYLNKGQYGDTIKVWQTYRNKKEPMVEEEIRRLLTLVVIADSQKQAKNAVQEEERLKTVKPHANTVAVCYYKDLSPDKSMRAFQKGLAAMVITDMSKINALKVVERVRLQALLEEMKLGQTGIVDEQTAPKVGRLVGAENLVVGNLTWGINAATSVASTSENAVKGATLCSEKKENFFKLPCCVVRESANILGVTPSPGEMNDICIPQTQNYNAFIYFGEGLDAFDAGDWKKAKDLFEMALKEDPLFELAKKWADSCPDPKAPSISEVKNMNASALAGYAESAYKEAVAAQKAAEEARKAQNRGGGGH